MTVRAMTKSDQLAALVTFRDYFDRNAFYWRRRAETPQERRWCLELEDLRDLADDLVGNLRMEGRSHDD